MKKIIWLSIALLVSVTIFAQTPRRFTCVGAQVKDPCGNNFNMRGINYAPYNWGYSPNELLLREVAKTGANTVRMSWYANNPDASTHTVYTAAKLANAIDTCAKLGMLSVVDLHDQTCANDPSAVIALANYFLQTDVKPLLMARQDKIVLNIANEALFVNWAGDPVAAQTTYQNTYATIISTLRAAGYYCPLMIDGPECGTNSDVLAAVGQALINGDPQHNIIFSAHAYWYGFANNDPVVMQQKIQTVLNAGIPLVLGEIANQQDDAQLCQYNLPYTQLLTRCQTLNVNWLAWSWYRDGCPNRQMTSTGNYANLTTYGNDLVNNTLYGIKNKAQKSAYLMGNINCLVATEQAELPENKINIGITNQTNAWQFISYHNTPVQLHLYNISGQLLTTITLLQNETITIVKPEVQGIFILEAIDYAGNRISKKLVH
jgi:mannan endo-1,4-beta-mannosidase